MWGGSGKLCGQADAAHRWTHAKLACFTLAFAFCKSNAARVDSSMFGKLRRDNAKSYRKQERSSKNKQAATVPPTAKVAARAVENQRKIVRKSTKNRAKSTKNRRKFAFGWFWAFKAVSGTRRDAFGTRPGRARAGSRAILGRPGRAKSGRETPKSEPGTSPLNQVAPGPGF